MSRLFSNLIGFHLVTLTLSGQKGLQINIDTTYLTKEIHTSQVNSMINLPYTVYKIPKKNISYNVLKFLTFCRCSS